MLVIIQDDSQPVTLPRDKVALAATYQLIAQAGQQFHGIAGGLLDAVHGKQAHAAMEQLVGGLVFLQKIGEAPVADGVGPVVVFREIFCKIGGLETGVVNQVPMGNRQVPFRDIKGQLFRAFFCQQMFHLGEKFCEVVRVAAAVGPADKCGISVGVRLEVV